MEAKQYYNSVAISMNIIFFTRLFYPHIGGVEKHALKISEILIKSGHEITILTEKYSPDLKDKQIYKKIKILRVSTGDNAFLKKFRIWMWLWQNRKVLKKADIIHCHDIFFWYLPFRFFYPLKKVYVTFHGYEGNKIPDWRSKVNHKMAELLTRGNVCVGKFLEKWYTTKTSFITYGGIVPEKKLQKTSHKIKTASFVGRLESETGFVEYLKALEILSKIGIKIKLSVFGDGSQKYLLKRYSKNINIKSYGFVNNLEHKIKDSDIIFTSRYLGMLEALSLKKFVIAVYNNSIKKDYLTMSPFSKYVVIAGDCNEIANSIINSDNLTHKKINAGYRWASKQTWYKLAMQYSQLWS